MLNKSQGLSCPSYGLNVIVLVTLLTIVNILLFSSMSISLSFTILFMYLTNLTLFLNRRSEVKMIEKNKHKIATYRNITGHID